MCLVDCWLYGIMVPNKKLLLMNYIGRCNVQVMPCVEQGPGEVRPCAELEEKWHMAGLLKPPSARLPKQLQGVLQLLGGLTDSGSGRVFSSSVKVFLLPQRLP